MTLTILHSLIYGAVLSSGGDVDTANERPVENLNPQMAERDTLGSRIRLIKYVRWSMIFPHGIRSAVRLKLAFVK